MLPLCIEPRLYLRLNAPLSLLNLPEQVRDGYANPPLHQGVEAIAEMLKAEKEGRFNGPGQLQLARFLITKIPSGSSPDAGVDLRSGRRACWCPGYDSEQGSEFC